MMPRRKPVVRLTEEQRSLTETCVKLAYVEGFKAARRRGLPRRLRIEASEAVGLAFLGLTQAAQMFKPELGFKFSTYATAAMRGEITKEMQRRNCQKRIHPKLLPLYRRNGKLFDVAAPVYDEMEASELLARVRQAVARLPERERFVVSRWSEGGTLDEIAMEIGRTKQRAHQLKRDGLAMLAEEMRL